MAPPEAFGAAPFALKPLAPAYVVELARVNGAVFDAGPLKLLASDADAAGPRVVFEESVVFVDEDVVQRTANPATLKWLLGEARRQRHATRAPPPLGRARTIRIVVVTAANATARANLGSLGAAADARGGAADAGGVVLAGTDRESDASDAAVDLVKAALGLPYGRRQGRFAARLSFIEAEARSPARAYRPPDPRRRATPSRRHRHRRRRDTAAQGNV